MQVKILAAAASDLEEGYRFYEGRSPGLGPYFLDSLYADIDSLVFYGGMHRIVFGYHRLIAKRFPFAVYYRLIEETVLVMAVLDCRRDPNWTRKRLAPN
ncbi:type II toxin-antitoxin system RelE/ParE family toxin [Methylococcus sp. ANG]|uniref:type II toxin-antitoxin system RelE/ParE family toxin n=1 Tax=unclassified Methylococcus TaxID=2618889 RepID=UPI001C533FB9|nr:type II toxin-antitoxin system RelE/ParE family toxin [Methylococcus sp. Mc7]QXP82597.1 type II toxin-antitoxin system RelE/ParE family toxin [Methylococcus sp. Mc7]